MFKLGLKGLVVGAGVGIMFVDCVGYIARVDGISMQPCLNPDANYTDYVFLSRFCVRDPNMIERGDVVSLVSPKNPEQKLIKRVIGLPGDIINTIGPKKSCVTVPEGHCWVEGDHKANSLDSNHFGPISLGLVTAKATFILWPLPRIQRLSSKI